MPLRFCFELDAVEDIGPLGEGEDRKLHWFGLTSGCYWISTPLDEVLRYTDEQVKIWDLPSPMSTITLPDSSKIYSRCFQ